MKKIPYIVIWVILVVGCLTKVFLPVFFIWASVLLYAATGVFYVASALRKNTSWYHTYIGWAWFVPSIIFVQLYISDSTSGWNLWYPIVFSACIATVIVWLWRNDDEIEHLDFSYLLNVIAIVFLAIAIASCPKMINSSIVTDMEFKEIEIIEKHIDENCNGKSWATESYRFQLGYEDELIDSEGFSVSKEYYNAVNVGDKVPVCIYTGCLGVKFYSFFEDPEYDLYGYNEWTKEVYSRYMSETA